MTTALGSQSRLVRRVVGTISRLLQSLGPVYQRPVIFAAFCRRRVLGRTTFIAVTGSVGKTTAKEALARGLTAAGPTAKSMGTSNGLFPLSKTILRMSSRSRFAVLEVGTDGPGKIAPTARLIRPDVAIITSVVRQHVTGFRDLDETAVEKATLLEALAPGGVAVLNRDDPRVARMKPPPGCSTLWFGRSEGCDCRIVSSSGRWPERFSLTVRYRGEEATIQTQLVGGHWENSIAAAVAGGLACGLPLAKIASEVGKVAPTVGRMQPIDLGRGATLIRDEFNGSFATFEKAMEFLAEARCERRVLVASDISDLDNRPARRRARLLGQMAAQSSDFVVFLGRRAERARQGAIDAGMPAESVRAETHWTAAVDTVREILRPGDLVLIKGPSLQHLTRLALSLVGTVECRQDNCGRTGECDYCPYLGFRPNAEMRQA